MIAYTINSWQIIKYRYNELTKKYVQEGCVDLKLKKKTDFIIVTKFILLRS